MRIPRLFRPGRLTRDCHFPADTPSIRLLPPSSQPAPECVPEAVQAAILIVAILVTLNPQRGALTLLRTLTIFLADVALEPRAADVVARLVGQVDEREDERSAEASQSTPPLHPALEALVTHKDEESFLAELARWPTELEAAEEVNTADDGETDDAVSGMNGAPSPRGERAIDSRGVRRPAGEDDNWTVIHRGSTGNGTTYRMLRRNGPAPGTVDGDGRGGLAQFRIEAVMEGVTAEQLARAQMSDAIRGAWDPTLIFAERLASTDPGPESPGHGCELAFWRMKFPMPLSPRDYLFVRRRWERNGAFYGVTRDATGRAGGGADSLITAGGGGFRVRRIFSGQRIRNVVPSAFDRNTFNSGRDTVPVDAGEFGPRGSYSPPPSPTASVHSSSNPTAKDFGGRCSTAAELVSVYHEDSGVPAAVVSLGACKGLLPYFRNLEAAARGPLGRSEEAAHQSPPRGEVRDSRWRALGTKGGVSTGKGSPLRSVFARIRSGTREREESWGGCSGENAVKAGHHGLARHRRSTLSKLKSGLHKTIHRTPHRHEHVHAEGRRRRFIVKFAGFLAMMAHAKKKSRA